MNLAIVHKEKVEPMSFENEPNIGIMNILYRYEPCNSSFETQIILDQHNSSWHRKHELFHCDICDYSFSRKGSLKLHVFSVHEKNKPFKCDICNYSSLQKSNLRTHLKSVHKKKKPMWSTKWHLILQRLNVNIFWISSLEK